MNRLRADIWVAAYVRTINMSGGFGVVAHKGAQVGGAIFILQDLLNGSGVLLKPVPMSLDQDDGERRFMPHNAQPLPMEQLDIIIAREKKFDPDLWLVVVESNKGDFYLPEGSIVAHSS